MLFDEKLMLEVCRDLGIEVVESDGYPMLRNVEVTPESISALFRSSTDEYLISTNPTDNSYIVSSSDLNAA